MIALVIPSNRPDSLARWELEWKAEFDTRPDLKVYVVRDEPDTWATIRRELGESAWVIPAKTDCIRAYGFWKAWCDGAETILTMDDDCYPSETAHDDWLATHEDHLRGYASRDASWGGWVSTIVGARPRGLPHTGTRPTGLNVGLWWGVPDVGADQQLAGVPWFAPLTGYIPRGVFFPMSGMNLAWRRALTPLMYFGLMGAKITAPDESWGVHRYGDIWCGVLAKPILDHLGYSVSVGTPYVHHDRASDPHVNLERERVAVAINEWLWLVVREVRLTAGTPIACLRQMADHLAQWLPGHGPEPSPGYWAAWTRALRVWTELFEADPVLSLGTPLYESQPPSATGTQVA